MQAPRAPRIDLLISRLGVALTAALLSVFMLLMLGREVAHLRADVQGNLETLAAVIGHNSEAALMFASAGEGGELLASLQASSEIEQAVLFLPDGQRLAGFARQAGEGPACHRLRPDQDAGLSVRWCGLLLNQPVLRHGQRVGTLVMEANLREAYRQLLGLLGFSLLTTGLTMAASVPLWRRLARRIAGPLDELVDVTRHVREHEDFSRRFQADANAEVQDLAAAFNRMLEQLHQRDVRLNEELGQRRLAEHRLNDLAYVDAVTGLNNRHHFMERIDVCLMRAAVGGPGGALLYIDLDGFKQVNDRLGHDQGDALLRLVGQRLRHSLRASDTLCRLGGDEFAVILEQVSEPAQVQAIAGKLVDELAAPYLLDEQVSHVSASVGICLFPAQGADRETVLRHADAAMYHAKQQGKNCYRLHGEQPLARSA